MEQDLIKFCRLKFSVLDDLFRKFFKNLFTDSNCFFMCILSVKIGPLERLDIESLNTAKFGSYTLEELPNASPELAVDFNDRHAQNATEQLDVNFFPACANQVGHRQCHDD